MSAPAKPWEGNSTFGGALNQNMQRSTDQSSTANTMFSNQGLYSSSPMPGSVSNIPRGTPQVRRVVRSSVPPPIPPPVGTTNYQQSQAYMPSTAGYGYGLGSYGATAGYGGYSGYGGTSGYGSYGGTSGYGSYGGTGYGLGTYGSGSYGSYGGYGGYGSTYGQSRFGGYGGVNRLAPGAQPISNLESRFIQLAEEGSRPAFQSIESLVQTFGSVSFMLESTFTAIYGSFRAVLGVAENFGRLRTLFGQVFSTFAVLRAFQWMYRKLMYYLGLRRENPGREAIWRQAGAAGDAAEPAGGRGSFWPMALFLGIVCSAPYLVWKLIASLSVPPPTTATAAQPGMKSWLKCSEPIYVGVMKYDFEARCDTELSRKTKETVWIAPRPFQTYGSDWLMVAIGKQTGLVPASYVHILGPSKAVPVTRTQQAASMPGSRHSGVELSLDDSWISHHQPGNPSAASLDPTQLVTSLEPKTQLVTTLKQSSQPVEPLGQTTQSSGNSPIPGFSPNTIPENMEPQILESSEKKSSN